MFEVNTAKVPVTYTKHVEEDNVDVIMAVGYLFTPNLLNSMQEYKKLVEELIRK